MQRTVDQLASELNDVYGSVAGNIFHYYRSINPLTRIEPKVYWENVRVFLDELHQVLYRKDHTHSVDKINTENYYFLCKMCVDRSFAIYDIISIRNDRDQQSCKLLANEIAHNVLPLYILYLRQIPNKTHYHNSEPGLISLSAIPPHMRQLQQGSSGIPPGTPGQYSPPQGATGQYSVSQYGMPQYGILPYGMPPYGMPQYGVPLYGMPDIHTMYGASGMPAMLPPAPPKIRPKPRCIRRGDAKQIAATKCVPLPDDDEDTFPLSMCSSLDGYVSVPEIHHVPKIMPLLNQVQPPSSMAPPASGGK